MILLVHSCDSRKWLHKYWWKFFKDSGWDIDVHFIQGEALFTDQLIQALTLIKDEYVWYTLDDYWIQTPINWELFYEYAVTLELDALRVQPNVQYNSLPYKFIRKGLVFKQTPDSAYKNTCATSIWRREYFLDSLKPGLNPWQWEQSEPDHFGNVYFVPGLPFWYVDGTRMGTVQDKYKHLI